MAITVVTGGTQTGSATNGGNVTLTFPTLAQNDVVIVFGGNENTTDVAPIPSGYTSIYDSGFAGTHRFAVSYKVMGASPDTTVSCPGSGNAADAVAFACYCLSGVDTANVNDATRTTAAGSSTNPNCASITTVTNGAYVLALAWSNANDAAVTIPAGYSNARAANATDTNAATVGGATLLKTTAGAEDPASYTNWLTGDWRACTVAIRPLVVNVAAAGGSYAITGTAASVLAKKITAAGVGAYALTGTAASVLHKWKTPAAAGSYLLTGTAASLRRNIPVVAGAGSYLLTGAAAAIKHGYAVIAGAGSYLLNGQAVTLSRTYILPALAGSYALTGSVASVLHGWKLAAGAGSYLLTGTAATLQKNTPVAAGGGSYVLTGTAASIFHAWKVSAGAGSYLLTGTAASLLQARKLSAGAGSYVLTGTAAAVIAQRKLAADAGSYLLTGSSVNLIYSGSPPGGEYPWRVAHHRRRLGH